MLGPAGRAVRAQRANGTAVQLNPRDSWRTGQAD
jgi:hypothetical protein